MELPLDRAFLARPAPVVAPGLLGLLLVRDSPQGTVAGVIVETEAYAGPDDGASHARAGRTRRTAPMFGPPGHAYVYRVYGLHECLNVVTGRDGEAGAVLIRAIAPVAGLELIRARRGRPVDPELRLGAGPARCCEALGVTRADDGVDLLGSGPLRLRRPEPDGLAAVLAPGIVTGPRVGVAYAGPEWATRPWRFGIRGHASLSRPFPAAPPIDRGA